MSARTIHQGPVTVINVFTVEPDRQQATVRAIEQMCDMVMKKQPGFRSLGVYKSLDGRRVAVQAQWESQTAFYNAFRRPEFIHRLQQLLDVAKPEWHVYQLVYSTTVEG